jgi:hypothetical protein
MQDYDFARQNAEVDAEAIRHEQHNGDDYIVAPVVAVQEMVLKGELLPMEEIEASVPAWNGRVTPVGHPTDDDGEFRSANSPAVHDSEVVGRFFEADTSDEALVGSVYVNVDESKRLYDETGNERFVKPGVVLASHAESDDVARLMSNVEYEVQTDDILEVSTAYFYRREDAMGTHDGGEYDAVQRDIRPDHLALLPNAVGECSAEDGCGAPRVHVHANVNDASAATPTSTAGATPNGEQASVANYAETNMNLDISSLAAQTAFDTDTLEGWDDDALESLHETVTESDDDASNDGDCSCGGHANDGEQTTNDGDGDGTDDGDDAIEALREEVQSLRSDVNREKKEPAIETILNHSDKFERDGLEAMEGDVLETMAEELQEAAANAAGADFGGRVGANATPGGSGDVDDDYLAMVRTENAARFGAPDGGS